MKFFIGLGNPGLEYQDTRHNIGFMVLDQLAKDLHQTENFSVNKKFSAQVVKFENNVLVKPMKYMNNSGQVSRSVINFYDQNFQAENIYVIHDDLDIELGQFKIQRGHGPKVHNGLLDLYEHLGTNQFWHVKVGVDSRNGDRSIPGSNYVLQKFANEQLKTAKAVSGQIVEQLLAIITDNA